MPTERDMLLGLLRENIGHDGAQGGNLAALSLDSELLAIVQQFILERGVDGLEPELVLLVKTLGMEGFVVARSLISGGYRNGALGALKAEEQP